MQKQKTINQMKNNKSLLSSCFVVRWTKNQPPTHGIVHAGFSGLRAVVARKKGRCKLIGNRFVLPPPLPHDSCRVATSSLPLNNTYYSHT